MKQFLSYAVAISVLSLVGCGEETSEVSADCPEVVYVGDGAEPSSFHTGGQLLGIDLIYPAYAAGEKFIIIDARPPLDHNLHSIKNSISLPYYDVEKCVDALPKDVWYITYCACPHNESQYAADVLEENGFSKVKVLDEGYIEWRNRGYPTTDNPDGILEEETPDPADDSTDDSSED